MGAMTIKATGGFISSNSSTSRVLEIRASGHHLSVTTRIDDRLPSSLSAARSSGSRQGAPRKGRAPCCFIGPGFYKTR